MDGGHKVRPTLWSVSLFLAVASFIVETVKMVRCSLLHSLWRFLGRMEVGVQDCVAMSVAIERFSPLGRKAKHLEPSSPSALRRCDEGRRGIRNDILSQRVPHSTPIVVRSETTPD